MLMSCSGLGLDLYSIQQDLAHIGDIKLGLMGFAYMQLPACSQHW